MREAPATQGHNEVDRLMKRVFDSRDATWQQLGDFILRETYTFEPEAPAGIPISGFRREYEWYVSDGVAVRSPVRSMASTSTKSGVATTRKSGCARSSVADAGATADRAP